MSEPSTLPSEGVPGCGFAAYGVILIGGFLLGAAGMVTSTLALLQASSSAGPSNLMPGNQVTVWRLQPMRDVGLLSVTDVPAAWHDETLSGTGTEACAMTETALLRVENGQGWSIPYDNLTSVTLTEGEEWVVEVHSEQGETMRCFFGEGEGGDRMAQMLQSEIDLTQ